MVEYRKFFSLFVGEAVDLLVCNLTLVQNVCHAQSERYKYKTLPTTERNSVLSCGAVKLYYFVSSNQVFPEFRFILLASILRFGKMNDYCDF
jgi:hypothetical protein